MSQSENLFKTYPRNAAGKGSRPRPVDKLKFTKNFPKFDESEFSGKLKSAKRGKTTYTYN